MEFNVRIDRLFIIFNIRLYESGDREDMTWNMLVFRIE